MHLNSILNHTCFISHGGVYSYKLRKKDIFLCEPRALAINMCAVRHGAQPYRSGHIVFNGVILDIMIKCSHDVRNVITLC